MGFRVRVYVLWVSGLGFMFYGFQGVHVLWVSGLGFWAFLAPVGACASSSKTLKNGYWQMSDMADDVT
jgi:hypothetical protein